MRVSIDWIRQFVDLPELAPKDMAVRFTMACAEVEDVIAEGQFWSRVRVAEITSIERHPEADKLNLVSFSLGSNESARVVCGASNVKVGLRVPYASIGTTLPGGFTLEPKKIRGILSEGMLCSGSELGIPSDIDGLLELPGDAPLGASLKDYLKKKGDIVLDIDNKSLTHRPDLWGHYGMAREFAAIFSTPLKNPFHAEWKQKLLALIPNEAGPVSFDVDDKSACLLYSGLSINNVSIGQSPDWMRDRLEAAGLRSINNIVDISNYVMLELGTPLHIFDRDKIVGHLSIHALTEETRFTTLDEVERVLVPGDTVIADQTGPLVLAGIMGGLASGVSPVTKNIFIEVANWRAAPVRRTSTRLGLRTDSSQRYEKSLDSALCERTLLRTLELILELCPEAKVVGEFVSKGVDTTPKKPLVIEVNVGRLIRTLGHDLPFQKVHSILEALDFKLESSGESLLVQVPSYRATKDIECEADIVEEIGRVIGYDSIAPVSPLLPVAPVRLTDTQKLHRSVKSFMSLHAHAFELMTYPLVGAKLLKEFSWNNDCEALKLINALSQDHDRMRDSLVPSLLEASVKNAKHSDEFRVFEIGRRYLPSNTGFSNESNVVGIVYFAREKNPFMDLLADTERLLDSLNAPYDLVAQNPKFKSAVIDESWQGLHPFEFINVRMMGKLDGVVFSLHPLMGKSLKLRGHLAMALIDLSGLEKRALKDKTKYQPLPKFPGSDFDYTITLEKGVEVKAIYEALKPLKLPEIVGHSVLDVFEKDEKRFVTMRTSFLDPAKTLSGDFLKGAEEQILSKLKASGLLLKE
jgi:phenylalanyl-tRNA synthetase beta chain